MRAWISLAALLWRTAREPNVQPSRASARVAGRLQAAVLLACASAACLACSFEPEYRRPRAPVPQRWPQGEAYAGIAADSGTRPLRWQDLFLHPGLKRVTERALAHNRDLRVALANVQSARAAYALARARTFPSLGVSADANLAGTRSSGVFLHEYGLMLGASEFELDVFGRLRSLSHAARERYLASRAGAEAVRLSLISETARAWLAICTERNLLAIARQTEESASASVDVTRSRFSGGVASELDVRQAETILAQARSDVAGYLTTAAQAENALRLLAGTAVDESDVPDDFDASEAWIAQIPAGLDSQMLLLRPEVQEAEYALRAANANIGAARAAFFPRLSLTALGGFMSDSLASLLRLGSVGFRLQPNVSQPIFTGGANQAVLESARAERARSVAEYERAIQRAFRDVADALARRGTIEAQLLAQQQLVAAAEGSYKLAEARYRAGADTYLNALDAQRTLYLARRSLVLSQRVRADNLVFLYRVLGAG